MIKKLWIRYLLIELYQLRQDIQSNKKYLKKIKIKNSEKINTIKEEIDYFYERIDLNKSDNELLSREKQIKELNKEIISIKWEIEKVS